MQPFKRHTGRVAALPRANVDTDQIIPKQFLKRIERTGYGDFLFYDWRKDPEFELNRPEAEGARILLTGRNFGCGSSREHAVWALQDFGFRAVVAPSFADIFYGNCTKTGLLPVPLPEADVRDLMNAERASIDLERQVVSFDGREVRFDISAETRERLLNGLDDIALTLQHKTDIDRFERDRTPAGSLTTAI
jgi:3-isopropylmalate/(R)-2-methylmalate dehydratase small subunit